MRYSVLNAARPALLLQAAAAANEWEAAFEREREGVLRGITGPLTPLLVLEELRRWAGLRPRMSAVTHRAACAGGAQPWLNPNQPRAANCPAHSRAHDPARRPFCSARAAEEQLAAQLARLQAREAGLAAAVCQAQAENLQLRQALHVAKQAAEPSVVQLRQLLLDPAVNREFAGLRSELEARTRELAAAQRELAARQFGPDPLLARMDKLQVGPQVALLPSVQPLLGGGARTVWR